MFIQLCVYIYIYIYILFNWGQYYHIAMNITKNKNVMLRCIYYLLYKWLSI